MSVTSFTLKQSAKYVGLNIWGVCGVMMGFFTRMWLTVFFTVFCLTTMGGSVLANLGVESNDVNMNFVSTNINWILDTFLIEYRASTIRDGKSVMLLDDIKEEFEKRIFVVDIYGSFEATGGRLKNLSTVHRTGDASLSESGDKVIVDAHLGLKELQMYFSHYKLHFFNLDETGTIQATVGDNSLYLELAITYKPSCSVTLTALSIDRLDNIQVQVTGLSLMDYLADNISTWLINTTQNLYRPQLESFLFTEMSKAVADADICHHLPF